MKTPESLKLRVITSEGIKDENSPLLLFGDSHNLVFDIGGEMHASSAGLASQLAFELKTGVDVMGVFGSGATPSRVNIMRRAKMDENFLKQKKVFIWCLSAREFTEGSGWSSKVPLKR
jgi:alginate O-acetyltransferase complex protein AlgJ